MITIPSPQDRKWVQTNESDVLGNLYSTFGCNLSENVGKVRSGGRLFLNTNDSDQANLGVPVGFKAFNLNDDINIIAVAGSRVFQTSVSHPAGVFTEMTGSGAPTDCDPDYSDIEVFNDTVYVSTGSKVVHTLSPTGIWGNFNALADNFNDVNPHMFTVFGGRLYMTWAGASVISWDQNNTTVSLGYQYSITLNYGDTASTFITFIKASSNKIWIGTINTRGESGFIYEWDGSAPQANKSYQLDSSGAVACAIKDDIPYIMNTNGEIQVWTGSTFKGLDDANVGVVGKFNRLYKTLLFNPLSTVNDRFVHPNGMAVIGGNLHVLVNSTNYNSVSDTEVTIPAGIWEYLPKSGLYHKYAVSYARSTDSSPYTDGGQMKISRAGALTEMDLPSTDSARNGTFICGAEYFTTATATKSGIWYDDSRKTALSPGYFVTAKMYSAKGVTESFQKLYVLFREFFGSDDKIVAKYRTSSQEPIEATITWASTTTFTTADVSRIAVGDEVQIIQGIGSGIASHITAINGNTVTVDQIYTGASSQTAIAWFQPWIKLAEASGPDINYVEQAIESGTTTWIQFKIWFNFQKFDEIESLLIASTTNQPA